MNLFRSKPQYGGMNSKSSNSNVSPHGKEENIDFSDDSIGQRCKDLWNEYVSVSSGEANTDIQFSVFANFFIDNFDIRDLDLINRIRGHPTKLIEHIVQLFLKSIIVTVSDGHDTIYDGLIWSLSMDAKNIVSIQIRDTMDIDCPTAQLNRDMFLCILRILEILFRWPHNQSIIVSSYGSNFSRIIVECIRSFTGIVEELVVNWADFRDDSQSCSDNTLSYTSFILNSLFSLVQFFSDECFSICASVGSISHPLSLSFSSRYWLLDFGLKHDNSVLDSALSFNLSPVENSKKYFGFTTVDFVAVVVSLLRKLLHFSSIVIGDESKPNQPMFTTTPLNSFSISFSQQFWRTSILIQCEIIATLLQYAGNGLLTDICNAYIQCSGVYAVHSVLSMRDVCKCNMTEKDILLIHMRSFLSFRLNSTVELSLVESNQIKNLDESIFSCDSLLPHLKWILRQSFDDVPFPVASENLSCNFFAPNAVPSFSDTNAVKHVQHIFSNRVACFSNPSFEGKKSIQNRWTSSNLAMSARDIWNESLREYVRLLLSMVKRQMKFRQNVTLNHKVTDNDNSILLQVSNIFIQHFKQSREKSSPPILQYHFLNFVYSCLNEFYELSLVTFNHLKLWKVLAQSPLFLLSGQSKVNNILKYYMSSIQQQGDQLNNEQLTLQLFQVMKDDGYIVRIEYLDPSDVTLSDFCRYQHSLAYKYVHDLVFNIFQSALLPLVRTECLQPNNLHVTMQSIHDIMNSIISNMTSTTSQDILVQTCRFINYTILLFQQARITVDVWSKVMRNCAEVVKFEVTVLNGIDNMEESRKSNPFFWPALTSLLYLMQNIASTDGCIGWIQGFLISRTLPSPSNDSPSSTMSTSSLMSLNRTASDNNKLKVVPDKLKMQRSLSENVFGAANYHCHFAILRLTVYSNCRQAALYFIKLLFHKCAIIASGNDQIEIDNYKNEQLHSFQSLTEALAHDILRVSFHIIQSSSKHKIMLEGYSAAIGILHTFHQLIYQPLPRGFRICYWRLIEKYGPMTSAHKEFSWRRSYGNVYIELWQSLNECIRNRKNSWPLAYKRDLLHEAIILMISLLSKNDVGKEMFGRVVYYKHKNASSSSPSTAVASKLPQPLSSHTKNLEHTSYNYEDMIAIVLAIEKRPSVDTVLLFFELLFDGAMDRSMLTTIFAANPIEYDELLKQCFMQSVPTFSNLSAMPFIMSMIPFCEENLQIFILKMFISLINEKSSVINLFKCTRMEPSFFDLIIDILPKVDYSLYGIMGKLLEIIGRHKITVAQLKRIFMLIQTKSFMLTSTLLDSLYGMIETKVGPQNFLFLCGHKSGLLLPPLQKWPANRGHSFSIWFTLAPDVMHPDNRNASAQFYSPPPDSPASLGSPNSRQYSVNTSRGSACNSLTGHFSPITSTDAAGINSKLVQLISIREDGGVGFEILLERSITQTNDSIAAVLTHVHIRTYNKKDQLADEVIVAVPSLNTSQSSKETWHHLAISHVSPSFQFSQKKSDITVCLNGQVSTYKLMYPRFHNSITFPMIGAHNPSFLHHSDSCDFHGKIGTIYLFSDVISESYLRGINKLGVTYGQIFGECDSFSSNDTDDEGLISKVLDGTLTSMIMLAYNPGVWKGRFLMDITPESNAKKWKILNFDEMSTEQLAHLKRTIETVVYNDLPWQTSLHANALRLKGTYHCESKEMLDSFDCLGGAKVLLPLFAHIDLIDMTVYESKAYFCQQILRLFFHTIRDTTVNQDSITLIASLSYVLEKISPDNLTAEALSILIQSSRLSASQRIQSSQIVQLRFDIIKYIFGNFNLWIGASFAVQKQLFQHLVFLSSSYGPNLQELIPIQKLIDCLLTNYNIGSFSDEPEVKLSIRKNSLVRSISNPPDLVHINATSNLPRRNSISGRAPTIDKNYLTAAEIDDIRANIFQIIYSHLLQSDEIFEDSLHDILAYITVEPLSKYKIEGLQFLLRLISPNKSAFINQILHHFSGGVELNNLGHQMVVLLSSLHSHPASRVRLYGAICLCSIIHLIFSKGKLPQKSYVPVETTNSQNPSTNSTARQSFSAANKSGDASSIFSPSTSVNIAINSSLPPMIFPSVDSFAILGISVNQLSGYFLYLQSQFVRALEESCHANNSELVTKEFELLFQIYQFTMHGLSPKSLIGLLEKDWMGDSSGEGSDPSSPLFDFSLTTPQFQSSQGGYFSSPTASNRAEQVNSLAGTPRDVFKDFSQENVTCMKICFSSLIPAIFHLLQCDIMTSACRLRLLFELKLSLQAEENMETLLTVSKWQLYFLDIVVKAQSQSYEPLQRLQSLGWNGDHENPTFQVLSSNYSTDLQTVQQCHHIESVVLAMINDMHNYAIRYGSPNPDIILHRPEECNFGMKRMAIQDKDLCESYVRGSRVLGAIVIQETVKCLRSYAESIEFDIRKLTIQLLSRVIEGVNEERTILQQLTMETVKIRRKILDLNLWLITYVISEFIAFPPIHKAKRPSSTSSTHKRFSFDEVEVSRTVPRRTFSNSVSSPINKFKPPSLERTISDPSTPTAADASSTAAVLSPDHASLDLAAMSIHNNITILDIADKDIDEGRLSSSSADIERSNSFSQNDESHEYFLSSWKLMETLLEVLGPIETYVVNQEKLFNKLKMGMKVGIVVGYNIMSQLQDSIGLIVAAGEEKITGSKNTPVQRIMDGVVWIVLRVLLNIYLQGASDVYLLECSPAILAIRKLKQLLVSFRDLGMEFYDLQVLYIVSRLTSALESSEQPATTIWIAEGCRAVLSLLYPLRPFLVSYLNDVVTSTDGESRENFSEMNDLVYVLLRTMPVESKSTKSVRASSVQPQSSLASQLQQFDDYLHLKFTSRKASDVALEAIRLGLLIPAATLIDDSPNSAYIPSNMSMFPLSSPPPAINIQPTTISGKIIFSWSLWNRGIHCIHEETRRLDYDFVDSKLTDLGMYKQAQEIHNYLSKAKSDEKSIVAALSQSIQDHYNHLLAKESKRFKDIHRQEDMERKRCNAVWNALLQDIANERGPWGHGAGDASGDNFWILYLHEDDHHQRSVLVRNQYGNRHMSSSILTQHGQINHYDQKNIDPSLMSMTATQTAESPRKRSDLLKDLIKYHCRSNEAMRQITQTQTSEIDEDPINDLDDQIATDDSQSNLDTSIMTVADDDSTAPIGSNLSFVNTEKVLYNYSCELITPATNSTNYRANGRLEVTKSKITFYRDDSTPAAPSSIGTPMNNVTASPARRPSLGIAPLPNNIFNTIQNEINWVHNLHVKTQWQTSEIVDILQRHYQLRFVAVEIFFTNRTSIFLNLHDKSAAFALIQVIRKKIRPPAIAPLVGTKPAAIIANLKIKSIITNDMHSLTTAWCKREISNFDYLMQLNTIAGRSFNDLGQYPIFPWILTDYKSETLNLRDPAVFRDLRYPIGAQTQDQRDHFESRYRDLNYQYESTINAMKKSTGNGVNYVDMMLPPFHFGTHYSVAGFVLWFLLRLEPYTTLHIQLQDGKFDKPDRLFHSIEAAFESSTHNPSDVKELVPELFHLPECLINVNRIDFGVKSNGLRIDNVTLPSWAKGSPYEFIRLHREALESDYVSQHLNEWIDLIFGYKQRPPYFGGHPAAVDACNVFFHLTYSGAVDLEKLKKQDKVLYDQYISQITEFGQTPPQLFIKPHPRRLSLHQVDVIWPIASVVRGVDTVINPQHRPTRPRRLICYHTKESPSKYPLICLSLESDRLISVDTSRIMGFHAWTVLQPDVIPPFRVKIDTTAFEISKGQPETFPIFSRFSNYSNSSAPKEHRLGVPFAPPVGYYTNMKRREKNRLSTQSSTVGTAVAGTWKPLKISTYEKLERRERDRLQSTTLLASKPSTSSLLSSFPSAHSLQGSIPLPLPIPHIDSSSDMSQLSKSQSTDDQSSVKKVRSSALLDKFSEDTENVNMGGLRPRSQSGVSLDGGFMDQDEEFDVDAPRVRLRTQTQSTITGSSIDMGGSGASQSSMSVVEEHLSSQLFAVLPELRLLFSVGHWDHSLRITSLDTGRLVQSVRSVHSDVITCVALAKDQTLKQYYLVTGSRDCTVMLWTGVATNHLNSATPATELSPILATNPHILYGHDNTVNSVAIAPSLGLVLSGSSDGTIILHNLLDFSYIRTIICADTVPVNQFSNAAYFDSLNSSNYTQTPPRNSEKPTVPSDAPAKKLEVNWLGVSIEQRYIVTYCAAERRLSTFSLNGYLLATKTLSEKLFAFQLSEDGNVLITGGDSCLVIFRWIHNLELANDGPREGFDAIIDGCDNVNSDVESVRSNSNSHHSIVRPFSSPIRSLHLTKAERYLLVGLESGELKIIVQDSEYLRDRLQKKLIEIGIL